MRVIKNISLSVAALVVVAMNPLPVGATGSVTISGQAGVDSGTPSSLEVCFKDLSTMLTSCPQVDLQGNYSINLDSTHDYHIALQGVVDGLTFTSSGLRLDDPQNSGLLNLTLSTSVVSSAPLIDQFGNIVSAAPATLTYSNYTNVDDLDYTTSGLTVYKSYFDGMKPTSYSNVNTAYDGTAVFRIARSTNYTYSARGSVGSNYARYGASTASVTDYQSANITLRYPWWNTLISGTYENQPSNIFTNNYGTVQWNTYPDAVSYDLYKTGPDTDSSYYVGELGQYLTRVYSPSYTSPTLMLEGIYRYRIVVLDAEGNVMAVSLSGSSPSITLDKTKPVGGAVTMTKTTITARTDPVTISMPSTDNVRMYRGEYFVDSDPGEGNGVSMSFDGNYVTGTTSTLASLPKGSHTMYVRAQDKAGNWSVVSTLAFSVK